MSGVKLSALLLVPLLLSACTDPVLDTQTLAPAAPALVPSAQPEPRVGEALGTGSLSGVVRDQTQKLLPGVTVRLNGQQTQTDQVGFFEFSRLEPGEFKLIAEASGYQPVAVTVQLQARRQVQDLSLQALAPPVQPLTPSPLVSPALQPVFLPPQEPSPASASPQPQNIATPQPTVTATSSPAVATPSPRPPSLYDPELDEAAVVELFLKRKANGVQLNFLLSKLNGLPVEWDWGVVQVEYYLAQPLNQQGVVTPGVLISSGRSVLTTNNQPFLLFLDSTALTLLGDEVYATCTLTLPDKRQLTLRQVVDVNL